MAGALAALVGAVDRPGDAPAVSERALALVAFAGMVDMPVAVGVVGVERLVVV